MKNKYLKFESILLIFMLVFSFSFSFAEGEGTDPEAIFKNISRTILNVFIWFGYAIAVGMLIWIGIKYVMSGANEKAKLKTALPKYMLGMALIVLCSTIAATVVSFTSNDTAEDIIDFGEGVGDYFPTDF